MESSLPDSLCEWLAWLERQHPIAIDMGLERVAAVARTLRIGPVTQTQSSSSKPVVITVAGTNGKGSTLAAVEALLQYFPPARPCTGSPSYGKYTSPHLRCFNERIVINGEMVADATICEAFKAIEQARSKTQMAGSDSAPGLSYFEYTTLAALFLFQRAELEFWLLEIGLGGRLDAVNIIDPDIAIITAIGFDHQDYLGSTLDAIGAEKAGIARPGIPVLVADPSPPQGLIDGINSRQGKSVLISASELEAWRQRKTNLHPAAWWAAENALRLLDKPLQQLHFDEPALSALASQVSLDGRLQEVCWRGRQIVLDVSHNLESVLRLADWLDEQRSDAGRVHALMAAMSDKPCGDMLRAMLPLVDSWSFCSLSQARAMSAAALQQCYTQLPATGDKKAAAQVFDNMKTALNSLVQSSEAGDKIVIFGSFYTVAAAFELLD